MASILLEEAIGIVQEMTRKIEQSSSKELAHHYLVQLSAVHSALLRAQRLEADNDLLNKEIAHLSAIPSGSQTVLESSHAITQDVLEQCAATPEGAQRLTDIVRAAGEASVEYNTKLLLNNAGMHGGFRLTRSHTARMLTIQHTVGVYSPCAGLKDLNDIAKQLAAEHYGIKY